MPQAEVVPRLQELERNCRTDLVQAQTCSGRAETHELAVGKVVSLFEGTKKMV